MKVNVYKCEKCKQWGEVKIASIFDYDVPLNISVLKSYFSWSRWECFNCGYEYFTTLMRQHPITNQHYDKFDELKGRLSQTDFMNIIL